MTNTKTPARGLTGNDAARSLSTFAEQNDEIAFAHLVTTALAGEKWAIERLDAAVFRMDWSAYRTPFLNDWTLKVIRATDCTRPDGAIARCGLEP